MIKYLLPVVVFGLMGVTVAESNESRPNVIFILTDDQGSVDLNVYGAKDLITPQMDKLAEDGVRFTQFYAGSPVCAPSRAACMTGLVPQRTGVVTSSAAGAAS